MKLAKGSIPRMGFTPKGYEDTGGSYRLHFPDGNATIARLLVRDLLPQAVQGAADSAAAAEDIVTAKIDYARLDAAGSPLRLRLNSTAVRVRHVGEPRSASEVEVTYVRNGSGYTARGRGVVLACYNMIIPYLCPELPSEQQAALHSLVKTPLVYTSVALRNWQAFDRLKVHRIYAPGGYHVYFHLNPHVTIGRYRDAITPDDPVLVHMVRTPCQAGLSEHDQNRAGRAELLRTSFETFERNIRDQLQRTLSDGGFDRGARYHGHHGQSMAARLCTRIQPALRSGSPRIAAAARRRPRSVRPHYHRQFGCRRRCVYRLGDQSRPSRRHGATQERRRLIYLEL